MRGLFLLGGSLPRKPGQYLMNNQGPYRNSKIVPVATGETIHFSVRVLLCTGLRSCPTLSKYSTEIEPLDGETKVRWHLHSKSVSHAKIDLPEEHFSDSERRLLESWMREEHKQSGKMSGISITLYKVMTFYRCDVPIGHNVTAYERGSVSHY